MIQLNWNEKEFEEKIINHDPPSISFDLQFFFKVNSVDIASSATTNCRIFFSLIYAVLKNHYPDELGDKKFRWHSSDNSVGGEGYDFFLNPQPGSDRVIIKYLVGDEPGMVYRTVETTMHDFVEAVIIANKRLLKQAAKIQPDIIFDQDFFELLQEVLIIKEWFFRRYGESL